MNEIVELICVKERSKLRVKITTPGYLNTANCQFPKNLRVEGRKFQVKYTNIKLIQTRGKYFYSIAGKNILNINTTNTKSNSEAEINTITQIFEDETTNECSVCLDNEKNIVFNCGHLYTCHDCSYRLTKCPICRIPITLRIDKNIMG
jgi:hypothetical protein|tara:strand:+ start:43 stop:486 length:444 start_codon:yes stop_codon:yes gene_type:complete